jgi:sirohydrochlorin cobaltochelatase
MFQKISVVLITITLVAWALTTSVYANEVKSATARPAIILASFGTTVPEAVKAITNIQEKIKAAFPGVMVKITFTSNIIRNVWKKRQAEAQKWLDQGIPEEILYVKNIIATFGDLREDGYNQIVVQPTHMFYMEQSTDLKSYVDAMRSIRTVKARWLPFQKIALGRPALGTIGNRYDYHEDLDKGLRTLATDVALARKHKARLVYMGHGNEHWSTGIYSEATKAMNAMYPDVLTYIGSVEGFPGLDDIRRYLKHADGGKIVLKPFMIVAGDHATNDMASDEEDSWKSALVKDGFEVIPVLEGLGSNDAFAAIFVDHIKDAAHDAGIALTH